MAWSKVKFICEGECGAETEIWFGPIEDEEKTAKYLDQLIEIGKKNLIKVVVERLEEEPDDLDNTETMESPPESVIDEIKILLALVGGNLDF